MVRATSSAAASATRTLDTVPQPVALVGKHSVVDDQAQIACTLEAQSMPSRLDEWRALLAHVVRRDPIDGGVRATFASSTPLDELVRLTAAEQTCCQFFSFAITIDSRGVALEVRAPEHALSVVHTLFGAPW